MGVWIWRRLLEAASSLHAAGWVHGAILPRHVLLPLDEHEIQLVGFGCCRLAGKPLAALPAADEAFYEGLGHRLTPALDLALCARVVSRVLGGDAGERSGQRARSARASSGPRPVRPREPEVTSGSGWAERQARSSAPRASTRWRA
jgi:hypothetical protein